MLLFDPPAIQAAVQRVRCRQIAENDFGPLASLLTRGFPKTGRDYWIGGFSRWRLLPAVESMPRYGYVLENDAGPVGAVLLISSRRGERIVSNLSGWYVKPAWRVHSALLLALATRLKPVTYVAATPAPETWRTLQTHGFRPYNLGRSAVFSWPGRGYVSAAIADELPEARLLRDHRDLGAVSLTVEKDGLVSPFVFKPRRLDSLNLRVMELIYCRSTADFRRCAPALTKHFLRKGVLGFLIDGRMRGIPSRYVEGEEPRYYKGPQPPGLNDLAYTRKTVFG